MMSTMATSIWKRPIDGFCFSSLILAIVGLPAYVLLIPSILAIIFGTLGLRRTTKSQTPVAMGRWMSVVGIVFGSIEVILCVVVSIGFL